MRSCAGIAEVQRSGCNALGNIASGDKICKSAVVDAGGVAAVLTAMAAHAADSEVQRRGISALGNIASRDAACKQAVADAGAAVVVCAAMNAHAATAEIQVTRIICTGARTYEHTHTGCVHTFTHRLSPDSHQKKQSFGFCSGVGAGLWETSPLGI